MTCSVAGKKLAAATECVKAERIRSLSAALAGARLCGVLKGAAPASGMLPADPAAVCGACLPILCSETHLKTMLLASLYIYRCY